VYLTKYHAMNMYPLFNYAPRHEDVGRKGEISPCILNRSARWRYVVSFTLRPLYLRERDPSAHWIRVSVG